MNLIFIGANGAGKTTLANYYYKQGYHQLRISPLAKNVEVSVALTLSDLDLVLDRWSVVDIAIYRQNFDLLKKLPIKLFNKYNLIFFLENPQYEDYDSSPNDSRVVQRPSVNSVVVLNNHYKQMVLELESLGIKVHHIRVDSVSATTDRINNIISDAKTFSKVYKRVPVSVPK